jgi:penicillin amidase
VNCTVTTRTAAGCSCAALALCACLAAPAGAAGDIERDAFGIPHIRAGDVVTLFELFGYAVAEDRLWQIEFFRRDARGRLAEIDAAFLPADLNRRLLGYTEAELQASFDALRSDTRAIIEAYVSGINRRIRDVLQEPDALLPYEFRQLGIEPAPWAVTDQLAAASALYRRFGTRGGRELDNLETLQRLLARHDEDTAWGMFNDLLWRNDSAAHTNIDATSTPPAGHAQVFGNARAAAAYARARPPAKPAAASHRAALTAAAALGLPPLYQQASFFFVIAGKHTAGGHPWLSGNPQPGPQPLPAIFYEAHLEGPGFDVAGATVAGQPVVILGHNRDLAWSTNVGMGDNVDLYVETLNPDDRTQYRYRGAWRDMERRIETFAVAGRLPVTRTFYRTVHGPIIAPDPFHPDDPALREAYAWKSAHWLADARTIEAQLDHNRARTLAEFEAAIERIYAAFHFIYADRAGNVAYWAAGRVPIRPAGTDFRLPLLGEGREEWTGRYRAIPAAVNPEKGFVTGWNTKASPDFDNPDDVYFGPFHRSLFIERFVKAAIAARPKPDRVAVAEIVKRMGRVGGGVGQTNAGAALADLLPVVRAAVSEVPPTVSDAARLAEALRRLGRWDGLALDDALHGRRVRVEQRLFDAWLERMIRNTFADEFDGIRPFENYDDHHLNMLLHAVAGDASAVHPSRDYFDDVTTADRVESMDDVALKSLREALESLGDEFATDDMDRWLTPRPDAPVRHLGPPALGVIASYPGVNSGVYSFISELTPAAADLAPASRWQYGASGFIGTDPQGKPDLGAPHLRDLLAPFGRFEFHPLFR